MQTTKNFASTGFKDPIKAEENRQKFAKEMDIRSTK